MKVSEWLKAAKREPSRKCTVCADKELSKAIAEFYAARKEGRTMVSWAQFRRQFLVPNGMPINYHTLIHHIRNCMGGMV